MNIRLEVIERVACLLYSYDTPYTWDTAGGGAKAEYRKRAHEVLVEAGVEFPPDPPKIGDVVSGTVVSVEPIDDRLNRVVIETETGRHESLRVRRRRTEH
jgi:hypothetical protein